jgi:hypothetical protein
MHYFGIPEIERQQFYKSA